MASTASNDYLENKVINIYLRNQITSASIAKIALFTSSPLETGERNYEPSYSTGYTRMSASGADLPSGDYGIDGGAIPPEPVTYWTVASASAMNNVLINFPEATSGGFGTITYIVLASGSHASTSGSNAYFYGDTTSLAVPSGYIYSIPINGMRVFFQGAYSVYLGNNIFNQFLNNIPIYLPGSNVMIALFTTLPDIYGNGGIEVPTYYAGSSEAPTGYQRKNISGTSLWTSPSTGSSATLSSLDWGTAIRDWGVIKGAVIYETVYNNPLFIACFNNERQVLANDSFSIPTSYMKVLLS